MDALPKSGRVLKVVELLKSGRSFEIGDLAGAMGVSRRTIYRDLTTLRNSGVWIRYDETSRGYFVVQQDRELPREIGDLKAIPPLTQELSSQAVDTYSAAYGKEFRERAGRCKECDATLSLVKTLLQEVDDVLRTVRSRLQLGSADLRGNAVASLGDASDCGWSGN